MARRLLLLCVLLLLPSLAWAQFTIPNSNATGINPNQSLWMQADVDALVLGIKGTGVVTGCAVTWSSGNTVAVAAGSVKINSTTVAVSSTTVALLQANGSRHRIDLIVVDSSGTVSAVQGTVSLTPTAPALPASTVLLAAVFVPAASLTLSAARVVDKRVFIGSGGSGGSEPAALLVTDYGAVGDGSTDDTAAIQAAVDAAIASPTARTVLFPAPAAYYKITAPIAVHGASLPNLEGERASGFLAGTAIQAVGYIGPVFHMASTTPVTALTYTTNLATGSGQALQVSNSSTLSYLDYTDSPSMQLNGLSQLSIELFVKITAYTTDYQAHILESSGSLTNASPTSAFKLKTDTTGHLIGCINVAGTCTDITSSAALSLDTTYQIELSYDGSNVTLFYGIPGASTTVAGTVSTTGTVQMGQFEMISTVGLRQNWPHGEFNSEPLTGVIDSIRFSNTARHTSSYTAPSTKFTSDSNTLLLENFDNETTYYSIVYTSAGTTYLNKYGTGSTQTRGGEVSRLEIVSSGSGLFLNGVIQGSFHDLTIRGGVYGINTNNDTFLDKFERIWFVTQSTTSRAGLVMASQNDINYYTALDFEDWPVGFIARSGSGTLTTSYFHGPHQVVPIVVREGTWNLDALTTSNEDAVAGVYQYNALIGGVYSVVINGGTWERYIDAGPAIKTRTGYSIVINGARFMMHASATEVVEVVSAPSQPIVLTNPYKDQSAVPWSTSSWVTVTPALILGPPTIASGFGTSPSVVSGGTRDAFRVNVGTGGSASSGVITMPNPPAPNGWNCSVDNLTAAGAHVAYNTRQTASSTTTVTVENQTTSTGSAVAWAESNILALRCSAY